MGTTRRCSRLGPFSGAVKHPQNFHRPTPNMTLRLDAATVRRLDQLAKVTERSKAWLAAQAVKDYLERNEWQIQAINAEVSNCIEQIAWNPSIHRTILT